MQLVINTFGASFHRKGELFRIKVGSRKVDIAAKKVQSVLISTAAHFSTDAIQLAVEHNIDVVLLDKYGHPFGRFWNGKMGSTAAIRKAQLVASENEIGLQIVKEWTKNKLENQIKFLKELFSRRPDKAHIFEGPIKTIENNIQKLDDISSSLSDARNSIMGLEGSAAAVYWQLLGKLPPKDFQFTTRSQHPGLDPVNAMINYGYGVLYSKVERACIIAGLDPYIGFLHTDNYNKKSLVFDLIEPFRFFVDRTVLKLFTGKKCTKGMFHKESSGVIILEKEAKELLIGNFNEYMDKRIEYAVKSSKTGKTRRIKRYDTIQAEAHSLANKLIGKENKTLPEIREINLEEPDF